MLISSRRGQHESIWQLHVLATHARPIRRNGLVPIGSFSYQLLESFHCKNGIKEEAPKTCHLKIPYYKVLYNSEEEYYWQAVYSYVSYLNNFCSALNKRFEIHKKLILSLKDVVPFCISENIFEKCNI